MTFCCFWLSLQSYHLTVELLQLVRLFRGTFDGLQGAFHSVQPVLAVRLLEHNLAENFRQQHFNDEFARNHGRNDTSESITTKKTSCKTPARGWWRLFYLPSTFEWVFMTFSASLKLPFWIRQTILQWRAVTSSLFSCKTAAEEREDASYRHCSKTYIQRQTNPNGNTVIQKNNRHAFITSKLTTLATPCNIYLTVPSQPPFLAFPPTF